MKKLLSISSSKILSLCGVGLFMTLGAFWHHQTNQFQLDRMNILNQGVGTCFNRISQTFTAMMIRDLQSPYLNRGFMSLSDECLNETIKGINPFKQNVGAGYVTLNKLISDVHWFHESVAKAHAPLLKGDNANAPLNPLSAKFSQMENLKINLVDEIDVTNARIREVQSNDEILMGVGLLFFVLSLGLLSLKEFGRIQMKKDLEAQALNLLKSGQANVSAMVDQLVERALVSQEFNVTAQIFKDYHGDMMEKSSGRSSYSEQRVVEEVQEETLEVPHMSTSSDFTGPRTSLKEVLVSLQNINAKDLIQATEVRDVQLAVGFEAFEQMMNAAINKLSSRRMDNKKIMISNQIHADRAIVNLFLAGNAFTATELEFAQNSNNTSADAMDMNMILLKEMAAETSTTWFVENKTDRSGNVSGMSVRFTVNRVPKDTKTKNLVSVFKGKKKDLAREMMN